MYLAEPVFQNLGCSRPMSFLQNKNTDFYSLLLLCLNNSEYNGQWMGRIITQILLYTHRWNGEAELQEHRGGGNAQNLETDQQKFLLQLYHMLIL